MRLHLGQEQACPLGNLAEPYMRDGLTGVTKVVAPTEYGSWQSGRWKGGIYDCRKHSYQRS